MNIEQMNIEIEGDTNFDFKINHLLIKGNPSEIITILSTESIDELEINDTIHMYVFIKTNVTSFKKIKILAGQRVTFFDMNDQPLHLPLLEKCEFGEISNCVLYNPLLINHAYASSFNMTERGDLICCIDCQGIIKAKTVNIINVNIPSSPLDLMIECDELIVKRDLEQRESSDGRYHLGHNYKINNGYVKKIRLIQVYSFLIPLETDEVIYDMIIPFESNIRAKKTTILDNVMNPDTIPIPFLFTSGQS